ncbi:MAG: TIGR03560 family F420-dependent LLM class oxidoreductase [Chloroflexota bacterium]
MAQSPSFGVQLPQQHRTWTQILDEWKRAEDLGFDTAWNWDHFVPLSGDTNGLSMEAWTLLAGIAAQTSRIRLGTLVTSTTYRNPAVLAKQVVTVDHISNGRLILGIGAGWHQQEHQHYGIVFPSAKERVDRFEESIAILDALMREDHPTFKGAYYTLNKAPFSPSVVQKPRVPILVGSSGTRMLRSVARYGDAWHTFGPPEKIAERGALLGRYCQEIGRSPAEIRWSVTLSGDALRSPDRFKQAVASYAKIGASEFLLEGGDWDALQRIAEGAIPEIRSSWKPLA